MYFFSLSPEAHYWPCKNKGFSLVELIVLVALIGVLSAIAIPSYLRWIPGYHLNAASREMFSSLQRAKLTAIKGNNSVGVIFNYVAQTYSIVDLGADNAVDAVGGGDDLTLSTIDLASYGNDVQFCAQAACGATAVNWNAAAISQAPSLNFSGRGLAAPGSIYLENTTQTRVFAISVSNNGALRLRKFDTVWVN